MVRAILIVAIEIVLGLWILFGWRIERGALLSILLNAGYFIFLSITLLRGVYVPNCGCFGVFLARPLEPTTLFEDLILIYHSFLGFVPACKKKSFKEMN